MDKNFYNYLNSLQTNNVLGSLKSFGTIPKPMEVPQYPLISQVQDRNLQELVPRALDYDMQGYHDKYGYPSKGEGEHYIDEFKLPNHPTFSNESMYSTGNMKGGSWEELPNKQYNFKPSKQNISNLGTEGLTNYFQRYENKGTNLKLPNKTVFGGIYKELFK